MAYEKEEGAMQAGRCASQRVWKDSLHHTKKGTKITMQKFFFDPVYGTMV